MKNIINIGSNRSNLLSLITPFVSGTISACSQNCTASGNTVFCNIDIS